MRETQAIRDARTRETDPYRRRFTFPKWSRLVTVIDEHSLFSRLPEFNDWTAERHEAIARSYAMVAKVERNMWGQLVSLGLQTWGDGDGILISGIYRNHWPEQFKADLRQIAGSSSDYDARSFAHWQAAGKRAKTWLEMSKALSLSSAR